MAQDVTRTMLLQEADDLIHGERAEAYGSALENATAWAQMFSAATGLDVKPEHYPVAHICTKLVRERHKHKRDNWRDIAGYAGVWGKMWEERLSQGLPDYQPGTVGDGPLPSQMSRHPS